MRLQDTERWQRLKAIFDEACNTPAEERESLLKSRCAGDLDLLDEIRQMLSFHDAAELSLDATAITRLALHSGQVLQDRFVIERRLGEGGMGEVFLAKDLQLNQLLALKTLHPLWSADPKAVQRLKREILLARTISHPNVCRIFEFYADANPFVTMEFIDGFTIAQLLREQGPFQTEAMDRLAPQIFAGLRAAHACGVLHRDLKPSNVMISQDRAIIMDFGLAKLSANVAKDDSGNTALSSAMGTPRYMSPEQLEGATIDHRSDVYSLGILFYEMWTGTPPYADLPPLAIAARRAKDPPPSPRASNPNVPEPWDAAIRRALALSPDERHPDIAAFSDALYRPHILGRVPSRRLASALGLGGLFAATYAAYRYLPHSFPAPPSDRYLELGTNALRAGSPFAAAQLLERATPTEEARLRLAEAYLQQDRRERAKDILLRISHASPLRDALTAAAVGDTERAATLLEGVDAARMWLAAGRPETAYSILTPITASQPNNAPAWLQRGLAEDRLNLGEAAQRSYVMAEQLFLAEKNDEGLIQTRITRGQDLDEALALSRALKSLEAEARVLFAKSNLLAQRGQGQQAIALAEQALDAAARAHLSELGIRGLLDLSQAKFTQYDVKDIDRLMLLAIEQASQARLPYLEARAKLARAQALARLNVDRATYRQMLDSAASYFSEAGYWADYYNAQNWLSLETTAHQPYAQAAAEFEQILAGAREKGIEREALVAEENLAEVEDHLAQFEAAIPRYQSLGRAWESRERWQKAANLWANGAWSCIHAGDVKQAARYLSESHRLIARTAQETSSSKTFLAMIDAELALAQTNYPEAIRLAELALRHNKGVSRLRTVRCQSIIGVAQNSTKLLASALREAEEAKQQWILDLTRLRHWQVQPNRRATVTAISRQLLATGHLGLAAFAELLAETSGPAVQQAQRQWSKDTWLTFSQQPLLQFPKASQL
jgi:hypothetical protein